MFVTSNAVQYTMPALSTLKDFIDDMLHLHLLSFWAWFLSPHM